MLPAAAAAKSSPTILVWSLRWKESHKIIWKRNFSQNSNFNSRSNILYNYSSFLLSDCQKYPRSRQQFIEKLWSWLWNFFYRLFFCLTEANSWLASCKLLRKLEYLAKPQAVVSKTASSQWQRLRWHGHQYRHWSLWCFIQALKEELLYWQRGLLGPR